MVHDVKYFYIYIFYLCLEEIKKNMKPLWKVKDFFNPNVRHTWVLSSFSVSLSVSVCVCLCLCVLCVVVVVVVEEGGKEEGGRRRREINRTIWAKVSLKIAETEQPSQVKRMIGGIGDMLIAIYSQT